MASCGSPIDPSGKVWKFDRDDSGQVRSVRSGDEIQITLQTIGPGHYDEHPSISSAAVEFSKVSYAAPPNPGGPRQLFQFTAVAAGQAVISIPHTFQNARFEITVDVR
jgi:YD repeat-containing protein